MAEIKEIDIQNEIRLALRNEAIIFRANVGTFSTADGRYISTGLPKGFSDLFGTRIKDGRSIYIEVKTKKGKPSPEQINFISQMKAAGAIAGICRSKEEAIRLVNDSR